MTKRQPTKKEIKDEAAKLTQKQVAEILANAAKKTEEIEKEQRANQPRCTCCRLHGPGPGY